MGQNAAFLAQLCLDADGLNVVIAVLEEAAEGTRAEAGGEAVAESGGRISRVGDATARIRTPSSFDEASFPHRP